MKKFTNILVTLGITLFLLTVGMKNEAFSQIPTECVSDTCFNDQPWEDSTFTYKPDNSIECADCWVKLYFKVRHPRNIPGCLGQTPEYRLDFALVSGSCYYLPCDVYDQWDIQQPYFEAMEKWLITRGFAPTGTDSCGPIFRNFTILSCFRLDQDSQSNNIIHACSAFGCCQQELKLCKDGNGGYYVNNKVIGEYEECSTDPLYPTECFTVCDWVDSGQLPKKSNTNSTGIIEKNSLILSPNPAINNLTIKNQDLRKFVEYNITDLNGNIINRQEINATNDTSINVSSLINGLYLISVKTEDGELIYNSFIINR